MFIHLKDNQIVNSDSIEAIVISSARKNTLIIRYKNGESENVEYKNNYVFCKVVNRIYDNLVDIVLSEKALLEEVKDANK